MKKADDFSDVLRHVPCKEAKHLFSDEVVDAFKRVADRDSLGLFESFIKNNNFKDVADYEKRYTKIISNVSEFQDELMLVIKNADERTALKIAEFASDYGKGVIGAVDKCGYDNIYKITHYISESGVSGKVASELFEALSKHGDTLIKAVEKCGPKNIENIVEILSKINPNQVDAVVDLLVHHGDDMVRAIKNCGTDKIDLIEELIKSGKKVNLRDVELVLKAPDAKVLELDDGLMWLEMGDEEKGLYHILYGSPDDPGHIEDFAKRGISDVKAFLYDVLQRTPIDTGSKILKSGRKGLWAKYLFDGKKYEVAYGTNGFIVSFYPTT